MNITLTGTVVSTKMQKTVVVDVVRKFRHPLYRKVITTNKKFKAHCEIEGVQEGDVVTIRKTSPISKQKHFIVIEKKGAEPVVAKETKAKAVSTAKKTVKSEKAEKEA